MVYTNGFLHLFCIFECCSKYWIPNNIEELDTRLRNQLIGQPLAYDLILRSISSHVSNPNPSKSLVLSLHGSTGTGKNFVAKHIVESLYHEGYRSTISEHLTKDIEKVTSECSQAIFIFDEIDQIPTELLNVILYYVDFHSPIASRSIDFHRLTISSNVAGTVITKLAGDKKRLSIKREDYDILEFEKLITNAAAQEEGGLKQASLIDRHLVTFFVPFLPLEREHIRDCIRQELQRILDNDIYEYKLSEKQIIDDVLNLIDFSDTSPEYSISGCKIVSQKLDFTFEHAMSSKQQQIDALNSEVQILQKKLDTKHDRDQFKSIADSLQEKCVQLKRRLQSKNEAIIPFHHTQTVYEHPNDSTVHLLKSALKTIQDEKEVLQTKVDELTRELSDVKGDLMIFRQKRHRNRISSNPNSKEDSSMPSTTKESNVNHDQQAALLKRLEESNERIVQLDNELKIVVCEREELEIERDSFKSKYCKLNQELNKMLNGDENRVIDIELIFSENRYLKQKINEAVEEKNRALANASKYKELLQTHRSAYNRLGKVQSTGTVLTHKQVQQLLKQSYLVPGTPETDNDIRSIAEALYENLKDKNMTITHQRKTNKILANRVTELEKLLADTSLTAKSDQTNTLINLLDRTPPIPDSATSQFVNSIDDQQAQTSPTQIFSFSSPWMSTASLTNRISDEDASNKSKGIKHQPTASIKNILECHQSRKTSNRSDSVDLEMDDPLQSPTLTTSIAYLEERDLLPVPNRQTSDPDHTTTNLNLNEAEAEEEEEDNNNDAHVEHLHKLLNSVTSAFTNQAAGHSSESTNATDASSATTNLTC
ncbi:unnamed protein product [Adineta ricciae]|uniref:AAA+ ATPase domain-containing protein n=1 Tax=Adineta ricciae TaxID=249248 RepID=A0A814CVS5_ADIRI|nr:unnamed protein product [Adineta ricciae]